MSRLKKIIDEKNIITDFFDDIKSFFKLEKKLKILDWAEKKIDFSLMPSAPFSKFDISFSPYLREPLQAFEFEQDTQKIVVFAASQQMGKSLVQQIGVLYHVDNSSITTFICYPSENDMKKMNSLKYEPLIRRIPSLAEDLKKPNSKNAERYRFKDSEIWFTSAGTQVKAVSTPLVIADEVDQFPIIQNLDNMSELEKRSRSFNESILYIVCSPYETEGSKGRTWEYFLRSSQGYYTLKCLNCNQLTIRSNDFNALQFETKYNEKTETYHVVKNSIRLVCPSCGHEHTEDNRFQMIDEGSYVHEIEELIKTRPGFQCGLLAYKGNAARWHLIAEKILECGKTAEIAKHYELDSWRGMPYVARKIKNRQTESSVKKHFFDEKLKKEDIEFIFTISDTQDLCSPSGRFAVDRYENLWLLEYREIPYLNLSEEDRKIINKNLEIEGKKPVETLKDFIEKNWLGIKTCFSIIDKKGHRTSQVEEFISDNKNLVIFAWVGSSLKFDKFKYSSSKNKTFLCDNRKYQAELIYYLYNQNNKNNNYLFLTKDLTDKQLEEITIVQPDKSKKFGHLSENWEPLNSLGNIDQSLKHDLFDVLKMGFFGKEMGLKLLPKDQFELLQAPNLKKRFNIND